MSNIDKVKEILYADGTGIFDRLRDRNYDISNEERNLLLSFAKECNEELKQGGLNKDAVLILLETVSGFMTMDEAEWTQSLNEQILHEIYASLEY